MIKTIRSRGREVEVVTRSPSKKRRFDSLDNVRGEE